MLAERSYRKTWRRATQTWTLNLKDEMSPEWCMICMWSSAQLLTAHSLERDPGVVSFRGDDRSQLEVHLSELSALFFVLRKRPCRHLMWGTTLEMLEKTCFCRRKHVDVGGLHHRSAVGAQVRLGLGLTSANPCQHSADVCRWRSTLCLRTLACPLWISQVILSLSDSCIMLHSFTVWSWRKPFLQLYRNDTALLKVRPLLSLKAIDCRICCLLYSVYLCLHVPLFHEGQPMMWMHFIDWNVQELLSKQMHYDWGLRAVKSLLRQAQSCTMPNPHSIGYITGQVSTGSK